MANRHVISYDIVLLEPCLCAGLGGDPNLVLSLDYVSGSAVRGALITRYKQKHQLPRLDLSVVGQRALFFGSSRYSNAYLLNREEQIRLLPVPRSFHLPKDSDHTVVDLAAAGKSPGVELVGLPSSCFCRIEANDVYLASPLRSFHFHNQRDAVLGRATESTGAVFRYDALARGQIFRGYILCDDDQCAREVQELLRHEDIVYLGGSRSAEYGQCRLENIEDSEADGWSELPDHFVEGDGESWTQRLCEPSPRVVVTLLSDAFVRNKWGEFDGEAASVEQHVQSQLKDSATVELDRAFVRTIRHAGFNAVAGLRMPAALALRMGSVFVLELTVNDAKQCAQHLKELCWAGIGERRAEGFGRLAMDWHGDVSSYECYSLPSRADAVGQRVQGPRQKSKELIKACVQRIVDSRLDSLVDAQVNSLVYTVQGATPSQLNKLRQIMGAVLRDRQLNVKPLQELLKEIRSRGPSLKRFSQARIGDMPLLDWLEAQLTPCSDVPADVARGAGLADNWTIANLSAQELLDAKAILRFRLRVAYQLLSRSAKLLSKSGQATGQRSSQKKEQ